MLKKGFQRPKRVASNDFIIKHHNKHHMHPPPHYNPHRPKLPPPVFWERPCFPSWDPNVHYANYHSQDDNYFDDYYNHPQSHQSHNDCCRYDSDSNINTNKPSSATPSNYGAYCSNRFYSKPPTVHQCYSCERSTSSSMAMPNSTKFNKVQRTI